MKTAVDKVKKGKGRVVNARFAVMCAHYLFDADFCNVATGWEKGVVEKNVQDSRRRIWIEAAQAALWLVRRTQRLARLRAAGRCGRRCATPSTSSSAWPRCSSTSAPHLMPMPAAVRRLRREAGARLQHLPGGGGAQPLLGAVRAGRPDGQHAAVPDAASWSWRRRHGGRPPRAAGRQRRQTRYDWQHYIPLLQRKPGALRNGAPFADMPEPLQRLRRACCANPGGDRVMAQVLAIVPTAGWTRCWWRWSWRWRAGRRSGRVSVEHVVNVLGRLNATRSAARTSATHAAGRRAAAGQHGALRQPAHARMRRGDRPCVT